MLLPGALCLRRHADLLLLKNILPALPFSKAQMAERKHDFLDVKSATLSADRKSVFLAIPDLRPAMQMQLKYDIKAADGIELRGQVINTIHALAE